MKAIVISAAIAIALGIAIKAITGDSIAGPIMLVILVILPLIGFLLTLDGIGGAGHDSSDSSRKISANLKDLADLAVRAGLCGVGFGIDVGWITPPAIAAWSIGLGAVAVAITFRKWIYGAPPL